MMLDKRIIYPLEEGIALLTPTGEIPLDDVARKDVPQGAPYRIVSADAVPTDRLFREAWEADFSEPDGFGDPEGWWLEQAARAAAAEMDQEEQSE